jgi:hypothetical protein
MPEPVRLLLVEDSEDDAMLIRRELERGGYDLAWKRVESEPAFVAALAEPWDVIISDFQMPHFNGLRAFSVYRDSGVETPFIFVSGALGEERAVEAMRAGARDYLLKDNLARLTVAVKRELAASKILEAQRRAEDLALRDQRRLAMALEASGAGVFEFTMPLGADTHYDPRWASLLGYAPEDLPLDDRLGTWLVDRLEPDNRTSALQTFERFIARRVERLDFELRVRHREGHLLHVGVSADATERDERGRATQVVGVMLNLTERRRLEAQFRQSQKMEAIGRLAGGVAHDVNNLLSVILTSGEFALLEIDEQHVARDDVQEMLNAAGRISALTEQLLAFSRSKPVTPRVLNINTVVAEIDRLLRRLVGKEVEMSTLMADDLWNVRIDLGSLEQVITNLVVNARDAMAQGGRLIVATSNVSIAPGHRLGPEVELAAGEYVTLAVSDEGVGMDEQTRRKIFEPFFTTKEPGKGTGLGLATCYGIAKQAGGYIGVESEPASGTTFTVYFPRVAETSDQPAAREDRTGTTLRGSESILVVEDDDLVRRTVVRILTGLGYHVTAVASGAQALTEYERGTPVDVLLTDMMLPDMTGDQVIEQVRAGRPGVKVVRMSGYTPSVTIRQGRELADVPVLRKPFTPEQMGRSIRAVLDG